MSQWVFCLDGVTYIDVLIWSLQKLTFLAIQTFISPESGSALKETDQDSLSQILPSNRSMDRRLRRGLMKNWGRFTLFPHL